MKLKRWQRSLLTLAFLVLVLVVYSMFQQGDNPDPAAPGPSGSQSMMGSLGDESNDNPSFVPGIGDGSQSPNTPNEGDASILPEVPENGDPSNLPGEPDENQTPGNLPEDGSYTSKEDVALYLHQYGRLPDNFITKKEAEDLGWPGGSLEPYAPGKCIGGDRFGNREGLLPAAQGRTYTECDIDTLGARSRGAKRIVFSNDGLIYYTEDHYESFELLYGEGAG